MPLLPCLLLLSVLLVCTAARGTPRSLLLNTTTDRQLSLPRFSPLSASVEDAVLNSQWDLLLRFRQENSKCPYPPADLSGWPTVRPASATGWPGVTVKNHRIVAIKFTSKGLCSVYPAYWSALTSLTSLNLANSISVGVASSTLPPASWGRLSRLKYLNLSMNFPITSIPSSWSNLTALTALDLSNTGFGFNKQPDAFWKGLSRLRHLDLSRNSMINGGPLPLAWTALQSLSYLDVSSFTISSDSTTLSIAVPWPGHLSALSSLRYLDVASYYVEYSGKPPAEWSKLKKLETLKLTAPGIPLNGPDLPAAWSGMKSLKHLDLPDLTWPGTAATAPGQPMLPQSWANLSSLRSLTTPCSNLLSKPARNGIPIASYLTALTLQCRGVEGCGGAEQVTQLGILSRMSNLQSLSLDIYPPDGCSGPDGAFPLTAEWSQLTKLTSLKIFDTYVTEGSRSHPDIRFRPILPPSWSTLVRLEILDIDCTRWALRFGGPLPASWSTLTALSYFKARGASGYLYGTLADYPGNASGGLPAQWSKLTRLQVVDLQDFGMPNVQLLGSWSALKKLNTLNLEGNCVGGQLPASWSNLHQLADLTLPDTRLWTDGICSGRPRFSGPLPGSWGALTKLTALLLADNSLSGTIPSEWSTLKSLRTVKLSHNKLKGPLPSSWSRLTKLIQLEAAGNRNLNGLLPACWSKLVHLAGLDLSVNAFTGQPPDSWGSLSALFSLDLSSNRLRGTIPPSWANMLVQNVTCWGLTQCPSFGCALKMNNNFLTGALPASWDTSKLPPIDFIDFSFNQLSGPLPTAPWNVANLSLSHNFLSGTLPPTWSTFMKASFQQAANFPLALDLSHNNFSGTLPASWTVPTAEYSREVSLFLSHNHLVGTVPQSYIQFYNLDLSSNKLTGAALLPFWCYDDRYAEGSFLEGTFLIDLTWNLSNNMFSGLPATACVSYATYLVEGSVDYSHNRLSGRLPAGWFLDEVDLTYNVMLDLSHNNMTGPIPQSWTNAAALNLSHNQLGGLLPKVWGQSLDGEYGGPWPQFTDFGVDLSYNRLQGPLPLMMYAVRHLDMSHNQLNGSVPPSKQWTSSGLWGSLTYVDLSSNSFTGKAPVQPKGAKYFNIQGNRFTGK